MAASLRARNFTYWIATGLLATECTVGGVWGGLPLEQAIVYDVHMSTTVTIRTDEALRAALEERARARGTTLSEVAREILRNAVEERPLELRTGHLRGRLDLRLRPEEPWRKALRERNWRS